jgi:hypothetical protein
MSLKKDNWGTPRNKVLRTTGNFSKLYTCPRFAHSPQSSVCIRLYKNFRKQKAEVIQNNENERVRSVEQGEARHRTYKAFKDRGNLTAA